MAKVRIVTDSMADLPQELVDKYNITVVPLKVFFGVQCFNDGVAEQYRYAGPLFCFIAHGDDPEGMQFLDGVVREKLDCREILSSQMGSVVGTHAGPGILGIVVCPYKYMQV